MEILNICMTKECRVWTIKDNYRLGDDIQSKVLAFAFGLSAEIERNLISQRTKEALARKKQRALYLADQKGERVLPRNTSYTEKKHLFENCLKRMFRSAKLQSCVRLTGILLIVISSIFVWIEQRSFTHQQQWWFWGSSCSVFFLHLRVLHLNDTFAHLFRSCCLSAPLRPLY